MRHTRGTKSSLFLIEFMIVLFFFLLVTAICIQVFVRAYFFSRESENLSHAQTIVQSFAEALKGSDGSIDSMQELMPELSLNVGNYEAWYDSQWEPCPEKEAAFLLSADMNVIATEKRADLSIQQLYNGEYLFEIQLHFHTPVSKEVILS